MFTRSGIAPLQLCADIPLKSQIIAGDAEGHGGRFSIVSFHVRDWTISRGRRKELPKRLQTTRFQRTLPFFFSIARISLLKFRRNCSFVTYLMLPKPALHYDGETQTLLLSCYASQGGGCQQDRGLLKVDENSTPLEYVCPLKTFW